MLTAFAILAWMFLGIIGLIVVALLLPIRLRAQLQARPELSFKVTAQIAGGLSPELAILDSTKPGKARSDRRKKPKPRKSSKSRKTGRISMVPEIRRLISGLIKAFKIEFLRARVEFGMQDPAQTGMVFGYLAPLQYGCSHWEKVTLAVQPNFNRACLICEADASVLVRGISLVKPLLGFAWRMFGPGK